MGPMRRMPQAPNDRRARRSASLSTLASCLSFLFFLARRTEQQVAEVAFVEEPAEPRVVVPPVAERRVGRIRAAIPNQLRALFDDRPAERGEPGRHRPDADAIDRVVRAIEVALPVA